MSKWIHVGSLADFDDGVFGVEVESIPMAIFQVGEDVYATHDICTHGMARLSEGYLEDGQIECPLHQGLFDVKTGAAIALPCTEGVKTFPTKIEDQRVMVDIDG